jgi:hypothetical protein
MNTSYSNEPTGYAEMWSPRTSYLHTGDHASVKGSQHFQQIHCDQIVFLRATTGKLESIVSFSRSFFYFLSFFLSFLLSFLRIFLVSLIYFALFLCISLSFFRYFFPFLRFLYINSFSADLLTSCVFAQPLIQYRASVLYSRHWLTICMKISMNRMPTDGPLDTCEMLRWGIANTPKRRWSNIE